MLAGAKRLYFRNNWEQFIFSVDSGTSVVDYSNANKLMDIRKVYIRNTEGDLVAYDTHPEEVSRSYSDHGTTYDVITTDFFIDERVLGGKYLISISLADVLRTHAVYVKEEDITYLFPNS
jgi:hypothetical protein